LQLQGLTIRNLQKAVLIPRIQIQIRIQTQIKIRTQTRILTEQESTVRIVNSDTGQISNSVNNASNMKKIIGSGILYTKSIIARNTGNTKQKQKTQQILFPLIYQMLQQEPSILLLGFQQEIHA
jgi:hypothetical protein